MASRYLTRSRSAAAVAHPGKPTFSNEVLDRILDVVRNEWKFDDWYSNLKSLSLVGSNIRPRAQKRLFRTLLVDFCSTLNNISKLGKAFAQNPLLPKYVEKLTIINLLEDAKKCDIQSQKLSSDHHVQCRVVQEEALTGILTALGSGQLQELQLFARAHPQYFDQEEFEWFWLLRPLRDAIEAVCASSPKLHSLVLLNCFNLPMHIFCHPPLVSMKLFDCSFDEDQEWPLGANQPGNLRTLSIACPHGSYSDIIACSGIIQMINLSALETFIVGANAIELLESIAGPQIKHLRLFCTVDKGIPDYQYIAHCSNLTTLEFILDLGNFDLGLPNPFEALARLQVPASLKTLSINFRVQAGIPLPKKTQFTKWAAQVFPTLDLGLAHPQWRSLRDLEIVLLSESEKGWFSEPFPVPFMLAARLRLSIRSLARTHEDLFSTTALLERPKRKSSRK